MTKNIQTKLTAYCLMTNARAARLAVQAGEIMEAWYCLATIYNIASFAACRSIVMNATEEALRIEHMIHAANAGRLNRLERPDAKVIPFPGKHKVIIKFPDQPTHTPSPTNP